MKLTYIRSIVMVVLGLLLSNCSMPVSEPDFTLRTVKLKILDEKTGEPLSGIHVYQVFTSQIHGGCWSFVMHLEPTDTKYVLRSATSDETGTATFGKQTHDFTCDEHPGTEYLAINLDLKSNSSTKYKSQSAIVSKAKFLSELIFISLDNESEKLIIINPRYRGTLVYGGSFKKKNTEDWWHGEEDNFDVQLNIDGYSNEPQEIVVKLRRAK